MKTNDKFLLKKSVGQIVLEAAHKTVFPNKCLFCRKVLKGLVDVACRDCGELLTGAQILADDGLKHISKIHIACDYAEEAVRHAIFRFKYEGKGLLARPMAEVIFRCFGKIEADFMLCVPSHPSRVKERGYNQAALLATELSPLMGVAAYEGMLRRRDTAKQFDLNPEERAANVMDAFALKEGFCVEGKGVLLVDDVLTTGSTAVECARILTEAGAAFVEMVVFAVPIRGRDDFYSSAGGETPPLRGDIL